MTAARNRCKVIVRIGQVSTTDSRILRAICDRPQGHAGWQHKGRLVLDSEVYGVIEWPRMAPK